MTNRHTMVAPAEVLRGRHSNHTVGVQGGTTLIENNQITEINNQIVGYTKYIKIFNTVRSTRGHCSDRNNQITEITIISFCKEILKKIIKIAITNICPVQGIPGTCRSWLKQVKTGNNLLTKYVSKDHTVS